MISLDCLNDIFGDCESVNRRFIRTMPPSGIETVVVTSMSSGYGFLTGAQESVENEMMLPLFPCGCENVKDSRSLNRLIFGFSTGPGFCGQGLI